VLGSVSKFKLQDRVLVKKENPTGTRRTPDYVRGKIGTILTIHGVIPGYEIYHGDFRGPVYSVMFNCEDLFVAPATNQKVVVDVHEYWLQKV
jgi:hypothetical protein